MAWSAGQLVVDLEQAGLITGSAGGRAGSRPGSTEPGLVSGNTRAGPCARLVL
jgi:hypothetical protein